MARSILPEKGYENKMEQDSFDEQDAAIVLTSISCSPPTCNASNPLIDALKSSNAFTKQQLSSSLPSTFRDFNSRTIPKATADSSGPDISLSPESISTSSTPRKRVVYKCLWKPHCDFATTEKRIITHHVRDSHLRHAAGRVDYDLRRTKRQMPTFSKHVSGEEEQLHEEDFYFTEEEDGEMDKSDYSDGHCGKAGVGNPAPVPVLSATTSIESVVDRFRQLGTCSPPMFVSPIQNLSTGSSRLVDVAPWQQREQSADDSGYAGESTIASSQRFQHDLRTVASGGGGSDSYASSSSRPISIPAIAAAAVANNNNRECDMLPVEFSSLPPFVSGGVNGLPFHLMAALAASRSRGGDDYGGGGGEQHDSDPGGLAIRVAAAQAAFNTNQSTSSQPWFAAAAIGGGGSGVGGNSSPLIVGSLPNQPSPFFFGGGAFGAMQSHAARQRHRSDVKKCRKIYGVEKKELWCTSCRWKKACTRFAD